MQDTSKKKLTHSTASVFVIERFFFSVLFVSVWTIKDQKPLLPHIRNNKDRPTDRFSLNCQQPKSHCSPTYMNCQQQKSHWSPTYVTISRQITLANALVETKHKLNQALNWTQVALFTNKISKYSAIVIRRSSNYTVSFIVRAWWESHQFNDY